MSAVKREFMISTIGNSVENVVNKTLPRFSHEDDQRQHKKERDALHPEKQEPNDIPESMTFKNEVYSYFSLLVMQA